MNNDYSEDALIEKPAVDIFAELSWETATSFEELFCALWVETLQCRVLNQYTVSPSASSNAFWL